MVQDFISTATQAKHHRLNTQLEDRQLQLELCADIIRNMQFGVMVWYLEDPDDITSFQLIATNPAASQITGVDLEEDLGKPIIECFPKMFTERRASVELYAKVATSGHTVDKYEVYYDDDRISGGFFNVKVFPLPNRSIGIVFNNITRRKQVEQALQESDERFQVTFEQAAVGLAHLGLDGRWLRVNRKLCEIVGYTHEELLQLKFQDITHPDDLEADMRYIRQLLAGEIENFSLEKRYIRKNGSIVWIGLTVSLARQATGGGEEEKRRGGIEEISLTPSSSSLKQGEPKYFIAVIEEINKRKEAEIALQQRADELTRMNTILAQTTALLKKRNDELDQFAYVASHDLKAPLRAIASLSEWMEEDLAAQIPEENQQQMRLLRGRVRRMEALINGLLEYSRVGRVQTPVSMVNVTALLKEVIDLLALPSTFNIKIEPGMPTFLTRRLLLQQVFSNLIGNAIKHHSHPNGHVNISVKDQGLYYEFSVSDDGPGIAPEYHDKVFLMFQTLEARDQKESTGVGLAIVKKIVETEGGAVSVDSQLGAGTTFRFTWLKQPRE